jgi:hypothetical protein
VPDSIRFDEIGSVDVLLHRRTGSRLLPCWW